MQCKEMLGVNNQNVRLPAAHAALLQGLHAHFNAIVPTHWNVSLLLLLRHACSNDYGDLIISIVIHCFLSQDDYGPELPCFVENSYLHGLTLQRVVFTPF